MGKLTKREQQALDRPYVLLNLATIEQYEDLLTRHKTKDWLVLAIQADVIGNELWVIRGFKYIEHAIEASTPRISVIGFVLGWLPRVDDKVKMTGLGAVPVAHHAQNTNVLILLERARDLVAHHGVERLGSGKIIHGAGDVWVRSPDPEQFPKANDLD